MEISKNVCRLRLKNDTETVRLTIEAIVEGPTDIETIIHRLGTMGRCIDSGSFSWIHRAYESGIFIND
jgi:hypothetical protein